LKDVEIAEAFCQWQGTLQEISLINSDFQNILTHAIADCKKLEVVLESESRSLARALILGRVEILNSRINAIETFKNKTTI
jgi:hypothetical protein